jgi:hypothetical protein
MNSLPESRFICGFSVNPPGIREDWMMVNIYGGLQAEPDRRPWGAEDAFLAVQRAEQAGRSARASQRSAADSLDGSADSHERTAKSYDQAAEHGELRKDEYREHAARHREFAQEDRRMAARMRQMAEIYVVSDTGMPWNRR